MHAMLVEEEQKGQEEAQKVSSVGTHLTMLDSAGLESGTASRPQIQLVLYNYLLSAPSSEASFV